MAIRVIECVDLRGLERLSKLRVVSGRLEEKIAIVKQHANTGAGGIQRIQRHPLGTGRRNGVSTAAIDRRSWSLAIIEQTDVTRQNTGT